jgi:hypothetical protein
VLVANAPARALPRRLHGAGQRHDAVAVVSTSTELSFIGVAHVEPLDLGRDPGVGDRAAGLAALIWRAANVALTSPPTAITGRLLVTPYVATVPAWPSVQQSRPCP